MKRIALTLLAVAVAAVAVESTASASDRSHGRSSAAVRHAIGDLIFGGHSYSRSRGHSVYRAPSHHGRSDYGYSPSRSHRSYARPSYSYPSRSYSGYGQRGGSYYGGYNSRRSFGYSYGRCD